MALMLPLFTSRGTSAAMLLSLDRHIVLSIGIEMSEEGVQPAFRRPQGAHR